jgi:hypothetical protein
MEPIIKAQIAHEPNYLSRHKTERIKKRKENYLTGILSFEPYKSPILSKKVLIKIMAST